MNLNEHIYRIKNLMYEQPQIKVVYDGDMSNKMGKSIELLTPNGEQIGKLFLTKLKWANQLDNLTSSYIPFRILKYLHHQI